MKVINCIICGEGFSVTPIREKNAKYCSMKCQSIHKKQPAPIGETFHRLTVLKEIEPEIQYANVNGKVRVTELRKVLCKCVCGNTTTPRLVMVKNGESKSCGCLTRDQAKINTDRTTHGLSKHPLYIVWGSMIQRCYCKSCSAYKNYGGRGITVCRRWRKFENFYQDMVATYQAGLELERRDNNGNYYLKNCRWATPKEQSLNKRNTVMVMLNHKKMPLITACNILGLTISIIRSRMRNRNISFSKAIKL